MVSVSDEVDKPSTQRNIYDHPSVIINSIPKTACSSCDTKENLRMTSKTPSKQYMKARSQPGTPSNRVALDGNSMNYGNMTMDSMIIGGGKGDM